MTAHPCAIVWIDHAQARVIVFDRDTSSTRVIRPGGGTPHLHHKANKELIKHLARHDPPLLEKVSGVQTVDHPTDGQLLDMGRRHFRMTDRGLALPA